ncbi:MAG: transposase, partial [Gammaproteobacteria bacterium]|nr:transposase [Gammaproteobacteria bacterium]
TTVAPAGTLRLILRDGAVEVHYAIDVEQKTDCGDKVIGVDKGFTEVLTDSDGVHHGEGLGKMLSGESDYLKTKYQRRSRLRAIAEKKAHKRKNIERFNLGGKKRDRRSQKHKSNVRDIVFKAVHAVADKAAVIAAEDLTSPMAGKKFNKNVNRRLASWTKGTIAEALDNVSRRRGSSCVLVNAAYTSQIDSRSGCLSGRRKGDLFYCEDGEVLQADENAARNILARLHDPGIDRRTPYKKVKSILLERTERQSAGTAPPGLQLQSTGIINGERTNT